MSILRYIEYLVEESNQNLKKKTKDHNENLVSKKLFQKRNIGGTDVNKRISNGRKETSYIP